MPAVPPPAKVLVTGANGFLAVWVTQKFLEQGYSVRGTVRNVEKSGKFLKEKFAKYGDKFELVQVPDITASGAFDEAVKGIDVIAHTASPFNVNATQASAVIDPAVKGTVSILESAQKSPSVKRVVLTSSIVAIWTVGLSEPKVFTEKDWNDAAIKEVEEKGDAAGGPTLYGASKALAEKAAWDFVKKHNPSWDLVVNNPGFIYGPSIHEVTSMESLNTAQGLMLGTLTGKLPDPMFEAMCMSWIDVRDVAEAHVLGAKSEKAGGTRCILTVGTGYPQDILDLVNGLDPKPLANAHVRNPGAMKGKTPAVDFETSEFKRIYGFERIDTTKMVVDQIGDFKERGWLQ